MSQGMVSQRMVGSVLSVLLKGCGGSGGGVTASSFFCSQCRLPLLF
uniref:Uncharacterized protein n=1 Tax=Anguilla anguilla TaxID=7936 RepID=A0A0E9XSY4_ANGAN